MRGLAGRVHGQPPVQQRDRRLIVFVGDQLPDESVHGVARGVAQPLARLQQPALKFRFPGQRALQQVAGVELQRPP